MFIGRYMRCYRKFILTEMMKFDIISQSLVEWQATVAR